jgi:nitrate reductase gamma subunit
MSEFITGPLIYIATAVFILGMILRAAIYINGLDQHLDRVAYTTHLSRGLGGAAYSIAAWMIPGFVRGWRAQPFMMLVFFCFHCGAVLLPLFLLGHSVMVEYIFGIRLPALSQTAGDVLTVLALLGLAGLAWRRIYVPAVRVLTTGGDWFVLALTSLPFLTGALGRLTSSDAWLLAHVFSAEVFLIIAPFTKLSHIVLFFMSRAQIGMDFAIKRGGEHRGSAFPW